MVWRPYGRAPLRCSVVGRRELGFAHRNEHPPLSVVAYSGPQKLDSRLS